MKELIDEISMMMETFRENARNQLDKGNKSAGLRARRASLDLEPLLKRFRKLSLAASNPNLAQCGYETDPTSGECKAS